MREMRNAYKVEVHKPKPKWKRSVHGWKHNILLYLKKRGQDAYSVNVGTVSGF
jgi:hypothetical protein